MEIIKPLEKNILMNFNNEVYAEGLPNKKQMFNKINEIIDVINEIIEQQESN